MRYVRQGRETWRLVGVYMSGDIERKLWEVEHWMEDKREGVKTILRGREGISMREQVKREEGQWRKKRDEGEDQRTRKGR